ncbi:M1 family metallopeptidase [Kangiella sediminilitoris]|uniref:Aminopeptidase n=1 Tax=Kangiella sediminilitoris TaxID=1144748 RepID=A0A1B3B8K3_9GAMM|nr:M1 family metallopeptidase [Kangiella sediminilitoris]AOE49132.1 Peptidase M1 membrane alanine aminopeptidase [Kangiella sediminilitoris]
MKKIALTSTLLLLALVACEQNDNKKENDEGSNTKVIQSLAQQQSENQHVIDQETEQALAESDYPEKAPTGRLPESIAPTEYDVQLKVDPDKPTFSGTVTIKLKLNMPTKHIWLHGKDIKPINVTVTPFEQPPIQGQYEQVDDTGVVKLSFDRVITTASAVLRIEYEAPFNEALEGLYRVKDGELNYAFTQFEATAARLAFPSFDEPAFKVPFSYTMTVRNDHKAFTSTPAISETDLGNGWKKIVFAKSKPLPTYLVAFAVGDFDVVEWQDIPETEVRKRTIPLRGIATKGKGHRLTYALKNTKDILNSLEEYFQIPYPYKKLDIVAVPDFNAGAMENAGLITYREQLLLFDNTISLSQKRAYMNVHAHELAHQWFGNLVTPVWWDDIWLNEAFATWMAHVSNNNIYPEQKFRQALLERSLGVMSSDSLISARQIRQPIKSNHDIQSAFDGITYSKGGGVLSMLEAFLGAENFRAGIQHYMRKFEFGNATAQDFITAIGEKSPKVPLNTIKDAFNSFLEQPGIPHLNVELSCNDDKQASLTIAQSRYLPLGSKGTTEQTWKVPACFKYTIDDSQHQLCEVLEDKQEIIDLPEKGCPEYIMPNANGAGYYRFSMSHDGWQSLLNNKNELNTRELMSMNNSLQGAINAGKLTFSDLVEIAPKIIASESAATVMGPSKLFSFVYHEVTQSDGEKEKLAKLNRDLYGQRLTELGLENSKGDAVNTIKLRNDLINFLANEGEDKAVRQYLTDMAVAYTGYQKDGNIHPELADSNVIGTALQVATEDLGTPFAKHLRMLLESSNDGTVRGRLLGGLGAVKDPKYAEELRELILSESLRDNEIYSIMMGQLKDEDLQPAMWQWFKNNIEGVKSRIPPFGQNRLPVVGQYFCSQPMKRDFKKFFKPIVDNLAGAPRTYKQSIESIELCIAQVNFHKENVHKFLSQQ